ncbi:MAG: leucine-rich repeat protein [Clostridia bacterium]|nr:leucine-rich repeat protein [Clostridia bacterium]
MKKTRKNMAEHTKKAGMLAILLAFLLLLLTGCGNSGEKPAASPAATDAPVTSSVKKGDYVTFGKYEQDGDEGNGKEDIEWLVLDVQGGKALLISRCALDVKPYESDSFKENLSWETCSLREWLNGEFFSAAFSAEEQAAIPAVKVSCAAEEDLGWSPQKGNDTQDQVYLLSISEARDYFASYEERMCVPTAYAWRWGYPEEYFDAEGKATVRWWTRSLDEDRAGRIDLDGDYDNSNVPYDVTNICWVRPVIWVSLSFSLPIAAPRPTATPSPEPTAEPSPTPLPSVNASGSLDNLTWNLNEDGLLIIQGQGGMYFTQGNKAWEEYKDAIQTVEIQSGVTGIAEGAFYDCKNLKSVSLPDTIGRIDPRAFQDCESLTGLAIPAGVGYIGEGAFSGCRQMTSVNLPDKLTWIYTETFKDCANLESIVIPDGVTTIERYAFDGCGIKSVKFPAGLQNNINEGAFIRCRRLQSVEIPEGIKYIANAAFAGCINLTNVTIPGSVTTIGQEAFTYCNKLESVTIPEGVTRIGFKAFFGCNLKWASLPVSLNYIDNNIFDNGVRIYYAGTEAQWWDVANHNTLFGIYYESTGPDAQ